MSYVCAVDQLLVALPESWFVHWCCVTARIGITKTIGIHPGILCGAVLSVPAIPHCCIGSCAKWITIQFFARIGEMMRPRARASCWRPVIGDAVTVVHEHGKRGGLSDISINPEHGRGALRKVGRLCKVERERYREHGDASMETFCECPPPRTQSSGMLPSPLRL